MYCKHIIISTLIVIISGFLSFGITKTASYAVTATLYQITLLVFPLVVVSAILRLSRNLIEKILVLDYGHNINMLFASIGTPIHESAHALFCILFRHEILEIKFFKPDRFGNLGYVAHVWNIKSAYQTAGNFFIGIAPLIVGTVLMKIIAGLVGMDHYLSEVVQYNLTGIFTGFASIFKEIFLSVENYKNIYFYLYMIVLTAIGSHLSPSASDMKNASYGAIVLAIYLVAANSILPISDWIVSRAMFFVYLQNIVLQALILNIIITILLSTVVFVKRLFFQPKISNITQ